MKHAVEDDANAPYIDFVAVALGLEDLWSQVVRGSTDSALSFALVENLGGQSEISNLESHMVREEQVSKLEVAVDDLLGVDVLDGLHQLVDVVAGLDLVKLLTAFNQVCQGLIGADVQHDVDILLVFEVSIEADDVLVIERPVNLNLTCQLLACLSSCQIDLRDDFKSPGLRFVLL